MRRDAEFLADITDAAEAVERITRGHVFDSFVEDETLRSAVLYQLVVIGEAAARLSAELRARYSSVPWQVVVGFRNVAVHAYFSIDWSIVWTTAASDVPNLREQILRIIAGEESHKP